MEAASPENATSGGVRSAGFHRRRARLDRLVRRLIGLGGFAVIAAIALIFFYLVYIVAPLFQPAASGLAEVGQRAGSGGNEPLFLALEEQREVGLRVSAGGEAEFFRVADGKVLLSRSLVPGEPERLAAVSAAIEQNGLVAAATVDGDVVVFRHDYASRFDGGVAHRTIEPRLEFPYGEQAVLHLDGGPVRALALSESDSGLAVAALGASGRIEVLTAERVENLLTGEFTLDAQRFSADGFGAATHLAISGDHAWLYVGDARGRLQRLRLPGLEPAATVPWQGERVTAMTMLLGGISLLVGDSAGRITQLFPVPGADSGEMLRPIRSFGAGTAPVREIVIEPRRKGFVVLDEEDQLAVYHATSGRLLHRRSLAEVAPRAMALAPRADGLLIEGKGGALHLLDIRNEHPEVSFASLWGKVWYENYDQPAYVWQSSAATREFEPKFSLTPLVFGTLKAALYAMLFAVPLALMGAAYTACFMAPRLQRLVKPGIEMMAALPTVILGFLAGLWLAPFIERHLAGLFALLLIIPPGLLLSAWLWHRYAGRLRSVIPEGFEPLLQLPVLVLSVWLAFALADPLQSVLFGQDLRSWLTQVAGIGYDQRNALVVGIAMGFAVIPTIFTIAEDALAGVPRSLASGSLALGATPWQTMVYVVLPTASPGIFSALMIGFGRAVGETMIVLMATGNTPIMDWNLFEGMRTLAANIAVELPESEVDSTHYRILFLAALVLFVFTFTVNTVADVVRQRLRERYGSL
jgi:phosphate transport system permease protein